VKEHLLSAYGPLLLAPAYTVPDETIGYITRYSPGSRENGGVYMHAATWALAAAAKLGDRASVERIWDSVSPAWRGREAESYWAEPYVTPGNVDGPLSDLPGRAGWTWYTGSAAWLNRVSLEWVLGVRPTHEGLLIEPCPPVSLGRVRVERRWRDATVAVSFDAGGYVGGVEPTVTVNGVVQATNVLAASLAAEHQGRTVEVEVAWRAHASVSTGAELRRART
jgi:cellobiose phosphorylase